jgi:PST family polysaccharide transporter/lipopolysaccharide exporter
MGSRVVKSGVWVLSQNTIGRILQLVMLLILARLIGPGEIGLVGIALLTLSAMRKFTNIGLNTALIQRKEKDIDSYLNTTWLLEIGRGLLILVVLVASAPLIAWIFDTVRAEGLVVAIAFSPVIVGLRNPGVVYFQKNLTFHKQFIYRISGDIVQVLVAVGYALVWPTAWAFVVGFLAGDAVRTLVSYLLHGYRPRLSFDRSAARDLISYGKWVTGSSILYFIYSEGDDTFVGWFLAPAALGPYQYAYRFSNAPATEISQVITSVVFPAYSKVQDNPEALRSSYLKTLQLISFVTFPMAFGILVVTPTFVRGFLGSEWTGMITAMQILTIYGLLRAIGKTMGSVWKATGRADIIPKLSALRVVLLALLIYPATAAWGIEGAALVVTGIYVFPMMPIDLYIVSRTIDASITRMCSEFVYPLVASLVMAGGVWDVHSVTQISLILEFFVLVAVGAVLYPAAAHLLETQFDWGISKDLRTILSSLRA